MELRQREGGALGRPWGRPGGQSLASPQGSGPWGAGLSSLSLRAPQDPVKKEEKSGSGQSPTQGTPKKEDAAKAGKGSKCCCPSV